jgi:hypothetical protein
MTTYNRIETRPAEKKAKVLYRLENEICRNWAQKGYWKVRIAMQLSYEVGSLREAWVLLKAMVSRIDAQRKQNEQPCENWVELITKEMGKSSLVCTLGC